MIYKLHEETLALVREERRLTGLVIDNLQKNSDERLFLKMGYSSLFEYCTKALGYSEACAYRRIQAVKVARVLPEVKEKLNSGTLNLTNLSMAQSLITGANLTLDEKRRVIESIENRSKSETEKILAETAVKKGIADISKHKEKLRHVSGEEADLNIRLKQETLEKLARLKSLRAHKNPNMTYAELIEDMCEFMLKRVEPKPAESKSVETNPSQNPLPAPTSAPQARSTRYIPAKLKGEIWHRDGGQCTYTDRLSLRRCESRHLLQIDHIQPLRLGGNTNKENLRILCHAHHREREFSGA